MVRTRQDAATVPHPATERIAAVDGLMMAVLALCCLGLVMAVSIRAADGSLSALDAVRAQGGRLLFGLLGFLVCALVPLGALRRAAVPLFAAALAACLLTHVLGGATKGAARWIELGSIRFQPVELARFALVFLGAHLLAGSASPQRRASPFLVFAGLTLLLVVALVLQPDHGNALFVMAVAGMMALVAGVRPHEVAIVGLPAAGGLLLLGTRHDYVVDRLTGFLEIEAGSQVGQGLVALAAGGVFGCGLGEGWMKMGYVSEARNDFVFAIIGEELGFVGALTVVGLYTLIGVCGLRLVGRTRDPFLRYLILGFVLVLCLQAGINMLVNVGWAPAKGIDLPFVSSGGTSLLSCLAAVGVIGNAARTDHREPT